MVPFPTPKNPKKKVKKVKKDVRLTAGVSPKFVMKGTL